MVKIPRRGAGKSQEHFHGGGLSGAVGAQKAVYGASSYMKVQPVDGCEISVCLCQIVGFNDVFHVVSLLFLLLVLLYRAILTGTFPLSYIYLTNEKRRERNGEKCAILSAEHRKGSRRQWTWNI